MELFYGDSGYAVIMLAALVGLLIGGYSAWRDFQ
jgi:hypothetical protein